MAEKTMREAKEANQNRLCQRDMHKNFFDRCQYAIESGFYMEAILMEYAAIEARLEVILGMLGLPCNQFLPDKNRKTVYISHRVNCLEKMSKTSPVFEKSKLPKNYFGTLEKWIGTRNGYIHGLYKSEVRYKTRMKDSKETAEKGLKLCRQLYNEASRIRRLTKKQNPALWSEIHCYSSCCNLYSEKNAEQEI